MNSHPACFFVSSNRPNQNRSSSFYYAAPALENNLFHQSFIGLLMNNGFDSIDHGPCITELHTSIKCSRLFLFLLI